MADKKSMSSIMVLKEFFGYRPGEGLKEFAAEIKALSNEDKMELATLAAAELGVTLLP